MTQALKMCAALGLALTSVSAVAASQDHAASRPAATASRDLERCMSAVSAASGFSGAMVVTRGDTTLLDRAYGVMVARGNAPVRTDTRFYIASISKQFTAAAILKLEEQGRLRVDDTIGKYLTNVPPERSAVTLHQILTHQSGIGQAYAADGVVDRGEAIRAILHEPMKGAPGSGFNYTNDGYSLLAAIIEIASGQTFEQYLRDQILRPAGLRQTGFWGDSSVAGGGSLAPIQKKVLLTPNWGFRGGTGMYSTSGDLVRWWRALRAGAVLAPQDVDRMLSPYVSTSAGGYGYGWFRSKVRGLDVSWTAGLEDFGHNAKLSAYPDGTAIAVASNAGMLGNAPARDVATQAIEGALFAPADSVAALCRGPGIAVPKPTLVLEPARRVVRSLASVNGLVPTGVVLSTVTYQGRRAVHVVNVDSSHPVAIALVDGTRMTDGSIEVDLAGLPLSDASQGARGFIGIAFRGADTAHFELLYVRPTNGRADDQLRRNHTTQYASYPDYPAVRLRAESPGVYESYADLIPGAWTHVKIEVAGSTARLYLNRSAQPALIVNDLKRSPSDGAIGLWIGDETSGYFSGLTVTPGYIRK